MFIVVHMQPTIEYPHSTKLFIRVNNDQNKNGIVSNSITCYTLLFEKHELNHSSFNFISFILPTYWLTEKRHSIPVSLI